MIVPWLVFIGFVLVMLALDLGVFHRKSHIVGFKESIAWSAVWITLGLSFSVLVYFAYDGQWYGLGLTPDSVDGLINNGKLAATCRLPVLTANYHQWNFGTIGTIQFPEAGPQLLTFHYGIEALHLQGGLLWVLGK